MGPDNALWFTEAGVPGNPLFGNKIGRINPTTGTLTNEFPLPPNSQPARITAGPDNELWFTESGTDRIASMTTTGVLTREVQLSPGSAPLGITVGPNFSTTLVPPTCRIPGGFCTAPDNAIWFTEVSSDRIGSVTTTGRIINEFQLPSGSRPVGITTGPDNAPWFTEYRVTESGASPDRF